MTVASIPRAMPDRVPTATNPVPVRRPLAARIGRGVWTTLVALLVVNVVLGALIDGAKYKHSRETRDLRTALPNYADHARAEQLYAEQARSWTYRPVPIEGWRRRPWSGRFVHVDARGSRVDPTLPARAEHTARFYGGSTMWGTGVEDGQTIPSQFARRRPGWAVVNEGESGWVSRQGIDRLINALDQDLPLDAAVFYDGVNDALFLCNGQLSLTGHMRELDDRGANENQTGWHMLRGIFAPELLFGRLLAGVARGRTGHVDHNRCATPEGAARVAHTLVANWSIAHDLMAARGRAFVAALQPVSYVGHPRLDALRGLPQDLGLGASNLNEYDRAVYLAVYPQVRAEIAARNVPWLVDLTDAFDTNEPTYIDYCHVSANGNALVAARLDAALAAVQGR